MSETMKINLDKASLSLKIISIVVGAFLAVGVAYASIDNRMDAIEMKQSTFEGVMEERTRSMADRLDLIYDIVRDWGPVDGKTKKETKGKAQTERKG